MSPRRPAPRPHRRLAIALIATALASSGCGLGRTLLAWHLRPDASVRPENPPPAPDYDDPASWAARPDRVDGADVVPVGERDLQASATAELFFVHPTTYHSDERWNQPLGDTAANERVDRGVLRNQASIWNGCCRVWAPRYRQATLYSFFSNEPEGARALAIAYGDVRDAFDRFLEEIGPDRPIVLASHSQGTRHALRLLEDRFTDPALAGRLVAAYLVGSPLPREVLATRLPDLPPCSDEHRFGCLLSWNTVEEGTRPRRFEPGIEGVRSEPGYAITADDPPLCVNPVTGSIDRPSAPASAHRGAARFDPDEEQASPPVPIPRAVRSACVDGLLEIDEPPPPFRRLGVAGDYHVVDLHLFYLDVRADAAARVGAYADRARRSGPRARATSIQQDASDDRQPR